MQRLKHRVAKTVYPSAKIIPHPVLYGRQFHTEFRRMPDGAVKLLRFDADHRVIEQFLIYPSQQETLVFFMTEPPAFGLALV